LRLSRTFLAVGWSASRSSPRVAVRTMTRLNPPSELDRSLASSSTSFSVYFRSPSLSSLYFLTPTKSAYFFPLAGAARPVSASGSSRAAPKAASKTAGSSRRERRGVSTGRSPRLRPPDGPGRRVAGRLLGPDDDGIRCELPPTLEKIVPAPDESPRQPD